MRTKTVTTIAAGQVIGAHRLISFREGRVIRGRRVEAHTELLVNQHTEEVKLDEAKFEAIKANATVIAEAMARDAHPAEAVARVARAARFRHQGTAYDTLSLGVLNAWEAKDIQPLEEAWMKAEQDKAIEQEAYASALILNKRIAPSNIRAFGLHTIEVNVGESGTRQGVDDLVTFRKWLKQEPERRDRMVQHAKDVKYVHDARKLWLTMPSELRQALIDQLGDPRFADQSAIVKDKDGKKRKASTVKAFEALTKNGSTWWAMRGAEWVIRGLFSLSYRWADSAEFWLGVPTPTAPWDRYYANENDRPSPTDEAYAAEEDKAYQGPFSVFRQSGRTVGERYETLCDAVLGVLQEFEEAAEMAEEWMAEFVSLNERHGRETVYAYRAEGEEVVAPSGKKVFTISEFVAITDLDEAIQHMEAKREERALKRLKSSTKALFKGLAGERGNKVESIDQVRTHILAEFSDSQLAAIQELIQ